MTVLMILKRIFLTSTFATILSGVLVFILSQLFIEYCLKPIQDFKKLKAKVQYELNFYANVYSNVIKEQICRLECLEEAKLHLSIIACEMESFSEIRPKFSLFIPRAKDLRRSGELIRGISNRCVLPKGEDRDYITLNVEAAYKAKKLLGIKEGIEYYKLKETD